MAYAAVSAVWMAGGGIFAAGGPSGLPRDGQRGIGALGLICPSVGPGETCRIFDTWARRRSRPRCTVVSGFDASEGSESFATELVSAAILRASPERLML